MSPDPHQHSESDERKEVPRKRVRRRAGTQQAFTAIQRPKWEIFGVVALILVVCLLGGGRSLLVKSSAVILIGILGMLSPAGYRLPKAIQIAIIAVVGAPLLAFLPASWLGSDLSWRSDLAINWGIALPSLSTAQPWVTAEAWLDFAIGIGWLAWCASRGTTTEDRRIAVRLLAVGLGILAILTLLDHHKWIYIPWWRFGYDEKMSFGPFANRNHTSTLMVIGSVISAAAAYDSFRRKEKSLLLYFSLLVPFGLVLVSNTSRAGLILYFVGMTLWLWTASLRKGFAKKIALNGSLVLVGIAVLFVNGGKILERLTTTSGPSSSLSAFRVRTELYQDTLAITARSPWTGLGAGNFEDIFPLLTTNHEPSFRYLHPESDWLWLMCEMGMLTLLAFGMLILLLFRSMGPWKKAENDDTLSRQDRRLRNALGIAAFVVVVHGFIDVPNHTPGITLLTALLIGLAIRSTEIQTASTKFSNWVGRLIGLGIFVSGCTQLTVATGNPVVPCASSAYVLADHANELSADGQDMDALSAIDRAIAINPLGWSHYFRRAQIHIRLNHPDSEALLDFGRARALEPNYAWSALQEGEIWAERNPTYAIPAWGEALRRIAGENESTHFYQIMTNTADKGPALTEGLARLAQTPFHKLTFLGKVHLYESHSPDAFKSMLDSLVSDAHGIDALDSQGRNYLFRMWLHKGDKATLVKALETNLNWQMDGWRLLSEEYAKEGNYVDAYKLAKRYELPPTHPSITGMMPVNQLEQNFLFNPTDARRGIDLYFGYKSKGEWNQALATLEKVAALPSAPNYLSFEMASIYAEKEDFRRAWELMFQYLNRPK